MSIGLTQMNSLLTSANTMKHVTDLEKNRGVLQRNMSELAKEIATAKEAGVNISMKEEKYSQMENSLNSNMEDIFSSGKDLIERIMKDNERIREEEAANASTSDVEMPSATTSEGVTSSEVIASGITEPIDTAEISSEAKAMAEADTGNVAHKPDPANATQTQITGKVFDKKV